MNQKIVAHAAWAGVLLFFALSGTAQTKSDSLFRKHWEVGLDVLSLFDKNNVPAASVFFRRNYSMKNGLGEAWRFRAGVETVARDFTSNVWTTPQTHQTYMPYLSGGHEWQRQSDRFKWFAGCDLPVSYVQDDQFSLIVLADSSVGDYHFKEINIGLHVFVGLQFQVSSSIAISIESALISNFRHWHLSDKSGHLGYPPSGIGEENENVVTTKIQPFQVINLIYKLNSTHHEHKKRN